jgi:hypothetical protein
MDPISTAVIAAIPALVSDLTKSAVKDGYEALKSVISRKWGAASQVVKAMDALEAQNQKSTKRFPRSRLLA